MSNQLTADSQLWDRSFSIFGINKYLEEDTKNIVYSLYKIATFIRQKSKTAEDISQITEFGYITQDFISSIYESWQDKLTTNKNNTSFRQCISVQFKPKDLKFNKNNGTDLFKSGKKSNVSRISSPIPPRPSKKVLEKSKLYKDKGETNDSQLGTQSSCLYA